VRVLVFLNQYLRVYKLTDAVKREKHRLICEWNAAGRSVAYDRKVKKYGPPPLDPAHTWAGDYERTR